jgi:hypothetical protein
MTIAPSESDPASTITTGRAAHITAARRGGPRFDEALTTEQRAAADNGIWLCADCADLIDKKSGKDFKSEVIRTWKRSAEAQQLAIARLQSAQKRPIWLDKLKSPHYVNVPRLVALSAPHAIDQVTLEALERGFPTDRFILRELHDVQTALRQLSIVAVDVKEITAPSSWLSEGLTVSFFQRVWIKNARSHDKRYIQSYSAAKSPQIYLDSNGYRYIFPFDPIWLTTSTAHSIGGSEKLAGIGIIKSIDHSAKRVIATPLTFGIPNLFDF